MKNDGSATGKPAKRWRRIPSIFFTMHSSLHLTWAKRKLCRRQRFQPGKMVINNWSIEYVDAPALASIIDLLLIKKINDFSAATTQPRILDCGANIGISVLNYKRKYPDSKITAFEPDPNIIPVLRNNLMNNNASDVEIVEAAVWVNDGVSQFFCEGADGSKLVTDSQNYQNLVKVPTVNLEKFINQPIDLIKMDIEGAEFEVIPHIEHKLHYVQNLLIECHFNTDEMGKFSRLLNVLANSGFFVAVAVLGGWNDLMRKPERNVNGFDQYILVSAWRPGK